jgi:hypothetical protein
MLQQSEDLRKAIENLMNATLHDALARPDGLLRVIAHRRTGTASCDVRNAGQQLERVLLETLAPSREPRTACVRRRPGGRPKAFGYAALARRKAELTES